MASKIIVTRLERNTPGEICVVVVMWMDVPVNKRVPRNGTVVSAYLGATVEEIALLRDGSVIEEVKNLIFADTKTGAAIQAEVIELYNAKVTAQVNKPYPGEFYGYAWDGSTWAKR